MAEAPSAPAATVRPGPDGTSVSLAGEIDIAARDEVVAALASAVAGTAGTVVVDLSAVTFMDSTGIGCLARAGRDLQAGGRRLLLARPTAVVRRVLEIAGVAHLCDEATP